MDEAFPGVLAMQLLADHTVRLHINEQILDKLVALQADLATRLNQHSEQMDMLRAILNALKDLQRARRN